MYASYGLWNRLVVELWAAVGGGFWPWSAWFSLGLVAFSHQLGIEYRLVSHLGRGIIYFIRFSQWQKTSSWCLHTISMVLDMCKKCFSKLQTIVLIPTHGLQKKRIENSDGKLPGNGVQNSKIHFRTKWTVSWTHHFGQRQSSFGAPPQHPSTNQPHLRCARISLASISPLPPKCPQKWKERKKKKNATLNFFAVPNHQTQTSLIAALIFVPKLGYHLATDLSSTSLERGCLKQRSRHGCFINRSSGSLLSVSFLWCSRCIFSWAH